MADIMNAEASAQCLIVFLDVYPELPVLLL